MLKMMLLVTLVLPGCLCGGPAPGSADITTAHVGDVLFGGMTRGRIRLSSARACEAAGTTVGGYVLLLDTPLRSGSWSGTSGRSSDGTATFEWCEACACRTPEGLTSWRLDYVAADGGAETVSFTLDQAAALQQRGGAQSFPAVRCTSADAGPVDVSRCR